MSMENRDLTWVNLDVLLSGEKTADAGPFPPRDAGEVSDLMSSILIHGVISPILVRRRPHLARPLEIVCGYRRCLAARAAGLTSVPALVADIDDAEAIRCYLTENLARQPMEAASEESAIETLQTLRWRTEISAGDVPAEAVEDQPPAAEAAIGETSLPDIEIAPPAGDPGQADSELFMPPEAATVLAEGLIEEMDTFLDEAALNRQLSPATAERLIDRVLLLASTAGPIDWPALAASSGRTLASHSVLVAAIAAHVAARLGWGPVEVRNFTTGALLHDVGMVFIRNPDIRAARALEPEERMPLASHARIGYALIAGARSWPSEVALAARDHHERWNGTGYPSGRRGGEIAFFPRLLAPLDTYAALIMPRPHRGPLLPPFALERVARAFELGQFDPQILVPLVRHLGPAAVPFIGSSAATEDTGNSVELSPDLVTMLSKESR
jgi:putative nucleotidyltransferase with HDIG domain